MQCNSTCGKVAEPLFNRCFFYAEVDAVIRRPQVALQLVERSETTAGGHNERSETTTTRTNERSEPSACGVCDPEGADVTPKGGSQQQPPLAQNGDTKQRGAPARALNPRTTTENCTMGGVGG